MSNFTYIPADVNSDVEMLAWLEEQAARVAYNNELWLQEQDEEYTEGL